MGLDYSSHPVDPKLFRERLVPWVMGRGDLSDLVERIVLLTYIRERTGLWRQNVYGLHDHMRRQQQAVAPMITHTYEVEGERTAADWLLGRKPQMKTESYETHAFVPGMPGLDPDLHIWGRPFFNTSETTLTALATHRAFMTLKERRVRPIDDICRAMVTELDGRRASVPRDLDPAVATALRNAPTYLSMLEDDDLEDANDMDAFDADLIRNQVKAELNLMRALWDRRKEKAKFNYEMLSREVRVAAGLTPTVENSGWVDVSENAGMDPAKDPRNFTTASEALAGLPYRIMGFAAHLEPGWMGQGSAYASSSLRQIGIRTDGLFQTPLPLFEEMTAEAPAILKGLHSEITDNFTLGGYIPPENVPLLVHMLKGNRDQLIRAWIDGESNAFLLQMGETEYQKTIEPATYAAENGFGYLEAAEIYSGFLGIAN